MTNLSDVSEDLDSVLEEGGDVVPGLEKSMPSPCLASNESAGEGARKLTFPSPSAALLNASPTRGEHDENFPRVGETPSCFRTWGRSRYCARRKGRVSVRARGTRAQKNEDRPC